MKIYFVLVFIYTLNICSAATLPDQRKLLTCKVGVERRYSICYIENQKVDSEGFTIDGKPNPKVESLVFRFNKAVKFLPENVAESFPKLLEYKTLKVGLKFVGGKFFKGLNELNYLSLEESQIETISSDAFKDLIKLQFLRLPANKIKFVDPKWFKTMPNLQSLLLSSNEIESLEEKTFENLTGLRLITLNDNKLTSVADKLFKNNLNLVWIGLHDNQIRTLNPTSFDHLVDLQHMDLRFNVCVDRVYEKTLRQRKYLTHLISDMSHDLENCKSLNTSLDHLCREYLA